LWPLSFASSDLWKLLGKIRLRELVSSNSENISFVSLLKHKNSRKQGTGTVASCQYVSSGNRIKMPQSVTKHKANGVKISMEHQKL
jgi:hypothetical protein